MASQATNQPYFSIPQSMAFPGIQEADPLSLPVVLDGQEVGSPAADGGAGGSAAGFLEG